jgi:hypothetical protein
MAGLNFSLYLKKLDEYLTKNAMEGAYQDVERSQLDYERIFNEFFAKTPYAKMNQEFIENGMATDNIAKMVLRILHRTELGRHSLILGARCEGRSALVANALIDMHDNNETNPMGVEIQLLRDLLGKEKPNLSKFHFPRWKNLAGKVFRVLEEYGYTPREIMAHMELGPFFSVLPEINERLGILPKESINKLNAPMGYVTLEADDYARAHAFLCEVQGEKAVTEKWFEARGIGLNIRFLGLKAFCEHAGVEDPFEFLEYVSSSDYALAIPAAEDFIALIIDQAGLEGLHRLSAKCINFLVKNTVLTPGQAVHLPAGGQRFAQSALERDLGL